MRVIRSEFTNSELRRFEMDDNSAQLHQNGGSVGQLGGGSSSSSNTGLNKQGDEKQSNGSKGPQYTMPGILHYIQHEFSRFEIERSQWDVDRAELQVNNSIRCTDHFLCFRCSIRKTRLMKEFFLLKLKWGRILTSLNELNFFLKLFFDSETENCSSLPIFND